MKLRGAAKLWWDEMFKSKGSRVRYSRPYAKNGSRECERRRKQIARGDFFDDTTGYLGKSRERDLMELIARHPRQRGSFDCGFDVPDDLQDDILQGYLDATRPENPWPGANRSDAYRHGYVNGAHDHGRADPAWCRIDFKLDRLHRIASRAPVGPEWWPELPKSHPGTC